MFIFDCASVVLTSASGPARDLGTINFTIWTGAIVSILLLIGEFNGTISAEEAISSLSPNTVESETQKYTKALISTRDIIPGEKIAILERAMSDKYAVADTDSEGEMINIVEF